jgi:CheY-like chemotaxis protein
MSKRLLIIDNDAEVLNVMQEALVYEGFEVKIQEEANDIFEVIEDYQPDLIMIDYILNGINGGETCNEIKVNPITRHIPVVIVSAYSKVILSLGNYRSDAFLAKPFGLDELVQVVNKLLTSETLQLI